MQSPVKYTLIVVVLLATCAVNSFAQSLSAKMKEMAIGADVILTGKVVHNESFWNEGKTSIVTKSSLQVGEYLKGSDTKPIVTVLCPGGEVGDVGELYTHMPKFSKDDEVLLFLKKDQATSSYKVFSGEDGKIPVLKDDVNGQMVTNTKMLITALKEQIKAYINESK